MQVPIYYMVCLIMWKTKRSKGTKEIWVISEYSEIQDVQKHKVEWIKNHYFKNTKVKPDILINKIISQKQIGITSKPEMKDEKIFEKE